MWFSVWLLSCGTQDLEEETAPPQPCLTCAEVAAIQKDWLDGCAVKSRVEQLETDCEVWGPPVQRCLVSCMRNSDCSVAIAAPHLTYDQEYAQCQEGCFAEYRAR